MMVGNLPADGRQLASLKAAFAVRTQDPQAQQWRVELLAKWREGTLSSVEATRILDWLRARPLDAGRGPARPTDVPQGKYALTGTDGGVAFYRVDRPEEGRWKGYTFVCQLLGSPGDWQDHRIGKDEQKAVLTRIGADPRAAAVAFGKASKTCGQCGAQLSRQQSRAAGYGKACAARLGWPYPSLAEAREILGENGAAA